MIIGFVVKCDQCRVSMLAKMNEMNYSVEGDKMTVLDRYVCDECIARHNEELKEMMA